MDDPKTAPSDTPFDERLQVLNADPYLMVVAAPLRFISVFDDLRYDRADVDAVSGPMRKRVVDRLKPLGFRQISGSLIENKEEGIRIHLPKFRALGASPFDAIRDTSPHDQDYIVLTPTQLACQFIDHYPLDLAMEQLRALIVRQPANLLRIFDYLERNDTHQAFKKVIGELTVLQRQAVAQEPLKTRRAL